MADWEAVVGPALAAVTVPRRLSSGTLTVGCAGPVAMELSHLAPQLISRINAHLGRTTVERLRFVQMTSASARPASRQTAPPPSLPERVETALANVPGQELREALARLARGVYRNRG